MSPATERAGRFAPLTADVLDPTSGTYRGAGRAWAAIDAHGRVVALRYMQDHALPEVERIDHPDRRYKTGIRVEYRRLDTSAGFTAYRDAARAFLARVAGDGGVVVGGMCSACEWGPA